MNILHVIDTTGPGGAETIFIALAEFTKNLSWKSIALIRGEGWVKDQLQKLGIETIVLNSKGSFNLKFLLQLVKIIKKEQIDVIQSHLLGSNVYASLAGIITKTPVICSFHGFVDVSKNERFRWLKFLIIRLGAKKIVAVTGKLKTSLEQDFLFPKRKTIAIPNGIKTEQYQDISPDYYRKKLSLTKEILVIGSLGNIREAKNYFLAIDVIKELISSGLNLRYLIAGDDTNKLALQLKERVHSLELDQVVHFLGFIEDVPLFLKSLDIFLISSASEGHPLALTQAMSAALPIVATKCGVEDIVENNETALIAESNIAGELVKKIKMVMDNPELKNKLSQNAQVLAQTKYSVDVMFQSFLGLYSNNV